MSVEAESANPVLNLEKCSVVLLDVAGTTTSINFVKETLFPYVVKKCEEFLKSEWENEEVKKAVKLLKDGELTEAEASAAVKELTDQNSDNEGLKIIQGLIYKNGYGKTEIKAHIFSDVAPSLQSWAKSRKVAIYSTGSVESQKLLFSHTIEGDLTSHITEYFDQSVGVKTEAESYENIAKKLAVNKEEIAFITDNIKEAKAAKKGGLQTALISREGNETISEEASKEFTVISSFKDVVFENSSKRKNEEETDGSEEQPPSKIAKTDPTHEKTETVENINKDEGKIEEKMEVDTPADNEANKQAELKAGQEKTEPIAEAPTPVEKTDESAPAKKPDSKVQDEEMTVDSSKATEKNKKSQFEPTQKEKVQTDSKNGEETKMEAESAEEPDKVLEKETAKEEKKTQETETDSRNEKKEPEKKEESSKTSEPPKDSSDKVTVEERPAELQETNEKTVKETTKIEEKVLEDKANEKDVSEGKEIEEKVSEGKAKDDKVVEGEVKEEKEKVLESKVEEKVEKEEKVKEIPQEKEINEIEKNKGESSVEETSLKEPMDITKEGSAVCKDILTKNETEADEKPIENKESVESEEKSEKISEEKENKSELANGVDKEVVNGDSEEQQNGNGKAEEDTKETESKVDEIKVKKIEDATESAPPVSVKV